MDKLGTLAIVGDVTVCSPTVRAMHQLIGATIELTVDGAPVGGGVANFTNEAFPVALSQNFAGKTLVAVQTLAGYADSDPLETVIGGKPTPADLTGNAAFYVPVYACTKCVWLSGLVPGAAVDVYSKAELLGSAVVNEYGGTSVGLNRQIEMKDALYALVTACGVQGAGPIIAPALQPMPKALPAPTIDPLFVCGQALYVRNVTPGALVSLHRNKVTSLGTFCAPIPEFPIYPIKPLAPMDEISVTVDFAGCGRYRQWPPLHAGSSTSALDMPPGAPQIMPLCGGQKIIGLGGLQTGATVKLSFNGGTVVFGAPAAATNYYISGGLNDGSTVTALQSLCADVWSPSTTRNVPSSTPLPPDLVSPPDKATNVGLKPTLVWKDGKGTTSCSKPTSFGLRIAKSVAGLGQAQEIPVPGHQLTINTALATNTAYHWQVRSYKASKKSGWCPPFVFTTVMSATSKPDPYPAPQDPNDLPGTWCWIEDCCPVYWRKVICVSGKNYNDALKKAWDNIKDPSCWIYEPPVPANFDCGTCTDPKGP